MNNFNLPDLGEGLPDAEISEWHVKVGDSIELDQPLVSMETAKAVVDVPSPQTGIVAKLFGNTGDIIKTGAPLVAFEEDNDNADAGTVVGNIKSSSEVTQDNFIIGSATQSEIKRPKATPKVRARARELGLKLSDINPSGVNGLITLKDVEKAAHPLEEGFEPLKGVRRRMVQTMEQSHKEVVAVSIFDDANISSWDDKQDITVRLIQAICHGVIHEPALNAWYNGHHSARKLIKPVHLGLATDTEEGLFVPVIHNASSLEATEIRKKINHFKQAVAAREVEPKELSGSTITLSNFGKFAGRYASPIIVPPSVAILGVGRLRKAAVVDTTGSIASQKMLPLSLSFDHRAVSGGEATRFLGYVMAHLAQAAA